MTRAWDISIETLAIIQVRGKVNPGVDRIIERKLASLLLGSANKKGMEDETLDQQWAESTSTPPASLSYTMENHGVG